MKPTVHHRFLRTCLVFSLVYPAAMTVKAEPASSPVLAQAEMQETEDSSDPAESFEGDVYEETGVPPEQVEDMPEQVEDMPGQAEDASAQPEESEDGYATFKDALSPYGEWFWTQEYGWVFRPHNTWPDWRPYTYGNWVYTDYGWTWVSSFPWGWAAFHYGSWAYLDYSGWVWIPGTVWSPARVLWRYSDMYVGWTPILAGYGLGFGWAYYPVHYHYWTFVHWNRFRDRHLHHHYIPRSQIRDVFRHTYYPRTCRLKSGLQCDRGPAESLVVKHTGSPLERVRVVNQNRIEGLGLKNGQLNVYRPRFSTRRVERGAMTRQPRAIPGPRSRPRSVDLGTVHSSGRKPMRAPQTNGYERQPVRRPTLPGTHIQPTRPSGPRPYERMTPTPRLGPSTSPSAIGAPSGRTPPPAFGRQPAKQIPRTAPSTMRPGHSPLRAPGTSAPATIHRPAPTRTMTPARQPPAVRPSAPRQPSTGNHSHSSSSGRRRK